ncbi:cell growth regulator with RING finger domain protein 1-like [Pectinophora gossypiella]|uniref:cell growth regulator with RING finger domain protein 1-like n=1 Tax=Pectinophora gossypiella TaxID=13191 RepID=UPI00214E6E29|nr:cell growth regulator with RING finger domain protein 1-like [Pectinophora gossypiella]
MGTTGLTLADLPNIFIMIGALVALFVMLVILLRNMEVLGVVGEGREQSWRRAMQPPRLLMQRVHIPFTFKLQDNAPTAYSGVNCIMSSTVRYWYASWWGAPVSQLHRLLWGSLSEILASSHLDFKGSNPHDERAMRLSTEEPPALGQPPRTCYPLVVILARDSKDTADLRPDDTVALVSVVHIRDEQCPLPSGILAQYLKQANGHLSCLKQLYVSGEAAEAGGYAGRVEPPPLCCVCAAAPLSRALLPCRHACLCAHCLPKLDKCPICRSAISSYFCIRNEEEQLTELKQPRFPLNRRLFNLFHYH